MLENNIQKTEITEYPKLEGTHNDHGVQWSLLFYSVCLTYFFLFSDDPDLCGTHRTIQDAAGCGK